MAVSSTATDYSGLGTGASAIYGTGIYANASNQIKVYVAGVLKTVGDDYSINGIGASTGVNVVGSFPNGATVYIERVTPVTQLVDTQNNETILADVLDVGFDKLTMIAQELQGATKRAILVPKGETGDVLPPAASRVGKFLSWDFFGKPILVSGSGVDAGLRADLLSSIGASIVAFLASGVGAVARTLQSKLQRSVDVFDYMTAAQIADVEARTETLNVSAAILAAFTACPSVRFPPGRYFLGNHALADVMVDLSGLGSGLSMIVDSGVEFTCNTTADVIPVMFKLGGNSHFSIGPGTPRFKDNGYDPTKTWRGAWALWLDGSTNWGNVSIAGIYGNRLVGVIGSANGGSANRIRGVHIGLLYSDDCYYGMNCQNQIDGLKIDRLVAFQNYRPYFVYGVTDHDVTIYNRNNRSTSGPVNICRQVGGLDTKAIRVRYVARDMLQDITHVLINHIDLLGGTISNIDIDVDIESGILYYPVRFVNYTGSGGVETNGASANRVTDVTIRGRCDVQGRAVAAVAAYASKGQLNFGPTSTLNFDGTINATFVLGRTTYGRTPAWTGAGGNPAIGNGAISSSYTISDGLCTETITMTAGSTTTFGSSIWSFGLAFTAGDHAVGAVLALQKDVQFFTGVAAVPPGGNTVTITSNAGGTQWGAAVPFAWGAGSYLRLTITYPIQ